MTQLLLNLSLKMIFHFFKHIKIGKKNRQSDIWGLNKHSNTWSSESLFNIL